VFKEDIRPLNRFADRRSDRFSEGIHVILLPELILLVIDVIRLVDHIELRVAAPVRHVPNLLVIDARKHGLLAAPLVVSVVARHRRNDLRLGEFPFDIDVFRRILPVGKRKDEADAELACVVALARLAEAQVAGRKGDARPSTFGLDVVAVRSADPSQI